MKKFVIFFFFLFTFLSFSSVKKLENINSWGYILQNCDIDKISKSGFSCIVMDYSYDGTEDGEFKTEDIDKIKQSGIIPIAYMSIGEAEDYRFYWKNSWNENPPEWLGKENPEWQGNYAVKFWYEDWKNIVYSYIDRILSQGFMGLYLDRVDVYEYWSDNENGENFYLSEEESAARMITFLEEIKNYCESKVTGNFYIIPQNGESLVSFQNGKVLNYVSAWAVEDLFYDALNLKNESEVNERVDVLLQIQNNSLPILVVDYVDDDSGYKGNNKKRIDDFFNKSLSYGFLPYAAIYDRELDELNIIPNVQPLTTGICKSFLFYIK